MIKLALFAVMLSFPTLAHGSEVSEPLPLEVSPVERGSSGAFEALSPLIEARTQFANSEFKESYKNYSTVFLR